jgi:carbohydrate-selective porin OprB
MFKARVAAGDVTSAAAVQQFFIENKLDAHFGRTTAGSVMRTIRSAVGTLISSLYSHSNPTENRMVIPY